MELDECVIHRVNAKTDRYVFWLKFFAHPMIMIPATMVIPLSPAIVARFTGLLGTVSYAAGLVSLLVYAYTRSDRPHDVARGVFFRPAWTAFCAAMQGRREFKRERLYMNPMSSDNVEWQALVTKQSEAYDRFAAPHGIECKEDWIALRTIAYLVEQGEKTAVWHE